MATERSDSSQGLVRRASGTAKTVFDEDQSTGKRVAAAAKIMGAAGAVVAGGIFGVDAINAIDPGLIHAVSPLLATGGIAVAAGGTGVGLASFGGWVAQDTATNTAKSIEARTKTRNFMRHTRTAALFVGGALGVAAVGIDGASLVGLAHGLAPTAQGLTEAAVAAAGVGLTAGIGAKMWNIGLPRPNRVLE